MNSGPKYIGKCKKCSCFDTIRGAFFMGHPVSLTSWLESIHKGMEWNSARPKIAPNSVFSPYDVILCCLPGGARQYQPSGYFLVFDKSEIYEVKQCVHEGCGLLSSLSAMTVHIRAYSDVSDRTILRIVYAQAQGSLGSGSSLRARSISAIPIFLQS